MDELEKEIFNEMIKLDENGNVLIDDLIEALTLDISSIKNLLLKIKNTPMYFKEAWYWTKFYMFITGLKNIKDNYPESIRLSTALFSDVNNKKKNGTRLLMELEKIDVIEKMDYFLNATRVLLLGRIDNIMYFRFINIISSTIVEDLEFISENANKDLIYKGNIQVSALEHSGLMVQIGVDANENAEEQDYVITKLGKYLDYYVLSIDNDEKRKWYEQKGILNNVKYNVKPQRIGEDYIKSLFK